MSRLVLAVAKEEPRSTVFKASDSRLALAALTTFYQTSRSLSIGCEDRGTRDNQPENYIERPTERSWHALDGAGGPGQLGGRPPRARA